MESFAFPNLPKILKLSKNATFFDICVFLICGSLDCTCLSKAAAAAQQDLIKPDVTMCIATKHRCSPLSFAEVVPAKLQKDLNKNLMLQCV